MKCFPNNKANSYKNQLSREFKLDGDWEVALTEVHYPHTWKTIDKRAIIELFVYRFDTLGVYKPVPEIDKDGNRQYKFNVPLEYLLGDQRVIPPISLAYGDAKSLDVLGINLPPGNYTSTDSVIETLKNGIALNARSIKESLDTDLDINNLIDIEFNKVKNRFVFLPKYKYIEMVYYTEDDASRLLGLASPLPSKYIKVALKRYYEGRKPPILDTADTLYIYSDIIEEENVGDNLVPLLRAISVKGNVGETVHELFDRVYYKRVNRNLIPAIEIQINTPKGSEMKFETGSVICVLHFRRVSS